MFGNQKLVFNKPINFSRLLRRVHCRTRRRRRRGVEINYNQTVQRRLSWRTIIYRTKPQGTMGHYTLCALFIVYPCHYFLCVCVRVLELYTSYIYRTWRHPLYIHTRNILYDFFLNLFISFLFLEISRGFPPRRREISFSV